MEDGRNEIQTEVASDEAIQAEVRKLYEVIEGVKFFSDGPGCLIDYEYYFTELGGYYTYNLNFCDTEAAAVAQDRLHTLRGKIGDARFISLEAPIVDEWRRRWQELKECSAELRFWGDIGAGDFKEGARIKVRVLLQQGKRWAELLPWVASVLSYVTPAEAAYLPPAEAMCLAMEHAAKVVGRALKEEIHGTGAAQAVRSPLDCLAEQEQEECSAELRFWGDLGAGDIEKGARNKVRVLLQQGKRWAELLPWVASVLRYVDAEAVCLRPAEAMCLAMEQAAKVVGRALKEEMRGTGAAQAARSPLDGLAEQELKECRAELRSWGDLGAGDIEEGARNKVRVLLQQGKSWLELLRWVASTYDPIAGNCAAVEFATRVVGRALQEEEKRTRAAQEAEGARNPSDGLAADDSIPF